MTFTMVHVVISLIGVAAGLVAALGMIGSKRLDGLNALFLVTTALTSVTGFFFPFHGFEPSYVVAGLSLLVLALAAWARYGRQLNGGWRRTYGVTSVIALYFNVFVLVVQCFKHIPALHDLAPTQSETPFKIAQTVTLVVFVILGVLVARRFRVAPLATTSPAAA
jgi:hypothetical protein